MNGIEVKSRKIVFGDHEINRRKLTRESNPMDGKNREVVTLVDENGTIDMKFGGIPTQERDLTNKFNAENQIAD
jgi:hypothetical protein